MVFGSVLSYNGEYIPKVTQIRAKFVGRGPFPDHEKIQSELKVTPEFRQGKRTKLLDSDENGNRKTSISLTLGSQLHAKRRNRSTHPVTADVIMKSKYSSGETVSKRSFPVTVPCTYNDHTIDLISFGKGTTTTDAMFCKLNTSEAGMYYRPPRSSASSQKKHNNTTSEATKPRLQQNYESSGKVSIPPVFLNQENLGTRRPQTSPNVSDNLGADSINRPDTRIFAALSGIPRGPRTMHQLVTRRPFAHPTSSEMVNNDPIMNAYDSQHVSSNREKRRDGNQESRNVYIRGMETGIIRSHKIPTSLRPCGVLAKPLDEHKQVKCTGAKKIINSSVPYNSARAVFASGCERTKDFKEVQQRPQNFPMSTPLFAHQSRLEAVRFPEAEMNMNTSQRTRYTNSNPEQIFEWRAHHNSPLKFNKNIYTNENVNSTPGDKFFPNNSRTPTMDFKSKRARSSPPQPSHVEWNGWCHRYISSKNIGVQILQDRAQMSKKTNYRIPYFSDEGRGKSILSLKETSTQTRPDKSISDNQVPSAFTHNSQATHRSQEIPRANSGVHTSPNSNLDASKQDWSSQERHKYDYPKVDNISRKYGEIFRSGSHSLPCAKSRDRAQDSPLKNMVVLQPGNRESTALKSLIRCTKSQLQVEATSRYPKAGAGGTCTDRKTASTEDAEAENLRHTSQCHNVQPLHDFEDCFNVSTAPSHTSNVVGRVSRVIGYFEKLTTTEEYHSHEESGSTSSDHVERVRKQTEVTRFRSGRLPYVMKCASCPDGNTDMLEVEAPREKCTSLPPHLERVQPSNLEDNSRKTKTRKTVHRSVSLMNKKSHHEDDGRCRLDHVKRSVSSVSGIRNHRYAKTIGRHSDNELDDAFWSTASSKPRRIDNAVEDIQTALGNEESYLRRKLLSDSSEDSVESEPSSPDNDYRFFRRAVYGSLFACEEAYACPYSPLPTNESEENCLSPSPSYSSTLGCRDNNGTKSESESEKSTSSDENLDYYSGVVEDKEEIEKPKRTRPCLRITEIVDSMDSRVLWRHIPEISKSDFFRRLSSNQLKLQETKFEVITSEAYYMECLCIVISHFYGSDVLNDESLLCKEDRDILFANIIEVKRCSQRFLTDLKWCWQDDISLQDLDEVIYKHAEDYFGAYVTYCFNQIHQLNVLNKLMKSEAFMQAISELESHPICRRRTLQCFLIMPMQRVTRIRLMVESILARLSPDNQKYNGWKMASDALNTVVQRCNKAAKHAELLVQSKSMCKKLDFSSFKNLDVHLTDPFLVHHGTVFHLHSSTEPSNHLGALPSATYRKIMKQPFTFGRKMKQPLHLFLFKDVLLITKKKSDDIFVVLIFCPRSDVDIFNGDPYSLQELPQKNIPENWKNVFHLFMQQGCDKGAIEMILSASSEHEKDLWLDAFSTRCSTIDSWIPSTTAPRIPSQNENGSGAFSLQES